MTSSHLRYEELKPIYDNIGKFQKQYNLKDSDFAVIRPQHIEKTTWGEIETSIPNVIKSDVRDISRQLDNAPDKKITIAKLEATLPRWVSDGKIEHRLTTGTVDGIPVLKLEIHNNFSGGRIYKIEETGVGWRKINEELYIPNKQGLEKLAPRKSNITKRDIITGLRDKKIKGGLVSLLQRRQGVQ